MADQKYFGGWGNHVLYRMCDEQPRHTNADIIAGKIWKSVGDARNFLALPSLDPRIQPYLPPNTMRHMPISYFVASVIEMKRPRGVMNRR